MPQEKKVPTRTDSVTPGGKKDCVRLVVTGTFRSPDHYRRNCEEINMSTILIIGATGMLGRPVAEQMIADGFEVTVLTTNRDKAEQMFGGRAAVVEGDVTDRESLKRAIEGKDAVFVNLNAHLDPEKYEKIEIGGTANVASVCKELGTKRLGNISGASSRGKTKGIIFLDAKVKAEQAIIDSGVPYSIMRPSWFFESLPAFEFQGKMGIVGEQRLRRRLLAAGDYAKQVSRAFQLEEAANMCFYNVGPEWMTLPAAIESFRETHRPDHEFAQIGFGMAKMAATVRGDKKLKRLIEFLEYMDEMDEEVDATETDRILGKNETTLAAWLRDYRE